jgi:tetratricopeptide (TPR) repeat protein
MLRNPAMRNPAIGSLVLLCTLSIVLGEKVTAQVDLDPWTIDHFQQAMEAQKARQYDKAAEQYRQILSRNPKFAEAYLNLGIVYQLQYRYAESIGIFREALTLKPDLLPADVLLGISYYMVQDFQAARKPLEEVLAHNPKERQAGIYLALALVGLDRPEDAARQLRRTAEYFPDDIEITYHLGMAYSDGVKKNAQQILDASRDSALYEWATAISADHKNDAAGALLHYLKALQIDPNIPQIYSRVSALFETAGFPDLARDAARKVSRVDSSPTRGSISGTSGGTAHSISETKSPEKRDYLELWAQIGHIRPDPNLPLIADTYVNKLVREQMAVDNAGRLAAAVASFEKGDFSAARAPLDAAMRTPDRHWIISYLLARCYMGLSDWDAAEKVVETSLTKHTTVPSVALLKLEIQSELAFRCYDFVLSQRPDSNAARILRAKSFAAADNPDKAIEVYRELLETQPGILQVHLGIAQIYADQLNWQGAIEELTKELELSPENGLALALLGHAYTESDQADLAIPILTKVLARYPQDASTLADLGKSFTQKGNMEKAIQFYERAALYEPSRYKLHYRLFQLYRSLGRAEPAGKHLAIFQAEDAKHRASVTKIQ